MVEACDKDKADLQVLLDFLHMEPTAQVQWLFKDVAKHGQWLEEMVGSRHLPSQALFGIEPQRFLVCG